MTPTPIILYLICLAPPQDLPDRPPPLTLGKHVDYVAWFNA